MDVYTTPEKSHNQDFELVYKGGRGGGGGETIYNVHVFLIYICILLSRYGRSYIRS